MGRAEKEYIVDEISSKIKENLNFYISNFINVDVERFNELRNKLTVSSSRYFVVKNKLCRLALEKVKLKELTELIDGPTGFVLCGENPLRVSKVLVDFSKSADGFSIIGGYIDGQLLNKEQVEELALLPSRKEIIAMFTYAVKSPIIQFTGLLGQLIKGLLVSLNEISKQKTEKSHMT